MIGMSGVLALWLPLGVLVNDKAMVVIKLLETNSQQ